jgi:hypothetical protein
MHCFTHKRVAWFLMALSAMTGLLCTSLTVLADPALKVYSASTHERGDVVYLNAQLEYSLNEAAVTALQSGVPITFKLKVEIFQPRKWIWDKVISEHVHRYQLSYHALTQQYLVTNISSGIQNSYSDRNIAISAMGRIYNLALVATTALPQQADLQARIKVSLDINALPTPMRPWAYISSDWKLSSEWYTWDLV